MGEITLTVLRCLSDHHRANESHCNERVTVLYDLGLIRVAETALPYWEVVRSGVFSVCLV